MNKKHLLAIAMMALSPCGVTDTAIYIDPETGQVTDVSPQGEGEESLRKQELQAEPQPEPEPQPQEVPSPVPGGGMMVEEKGAPR